jgi:hypothetical protein
MKIDGRRLLAVSASATTVAALEVLLVNGARRLRRDTSSSPLSWKEPSTTARWGHLLLREVLASLQAELVQRQLRTSVALDRALAGQHETAPSIPTQRTSRLTSSPPAAQPTPRLQPVRGRDSDT